MSKGIDPILGEISVIQLALVEDQLTNCQEASDEELQEFFLENGLTEEQAKQALKYRELYMLNIYNIGSTPIRDGDDAYNYNPNSGYFEKGSPRRATAPAEPRAKKRTR